MVLLVAQVREAFQAHRVPWDHPALLEWEKEVKMGFQDSQAPKVIDHLDLTKLCNLI